MTKEKIDFDAVANELKRMRVSDGYSAADLFRILPQMDAEVMSFSKGDAMLRAGEGMRRLGVILEGIVHVAMRGDGGNVILQMLSAGSFVGLTSLIAPLDPTPMTFSAFTDVTLLTMSVEKLLAWRRDPASDCFFATMERQMHKMMLAMAYKCVILSQPKIEDRVLTCLKQRCAERGSRTVVIPGNESDFANYLGVHVAALSRVLSKMREEGLIDYRRNILTLNGSAEDGKSRAHGLDAKNRKRIDNKRK